LTRLKFSESIDHNLLEIDKTNKSISQISSEFQNTVKEEYDAIDVLNFCAPAYHSKNLKLLQESCDLLCKKICSDNWTIHKIQKKNYIKFIEVVKKVIQ